MRTILPAKHRLIPSQAKRVFQGQIYDVYQWPQEMFDGSTATFEMLKRPDTIQIMAVKDHKLVVLEEQQPSMGPAFYGLPGGRHDNPAETELDAAKRELLEETGMTFTNWRLIEVTQPHSKIDWMVYLYLATDFESQGPIHLDAGEKIEVSLMDYSQVLGLAKDDSVRSLPFEILQTAGSLDGLTKLPQFGVVNSKL
ncbi:MAG TPA: NUDIX hydrolase [Candidatus Saccharimonadia bacterium]|nr:NUDIX hydrolase [Candidatus Saccharimonadia bacterium]